MCHPYLWGTFPNLTHWKHNHLVWVFVYRVYSIYVYVLSVLSIIICIYYIFYVLSYLSDSEDAIIRYDRNPVIHPDVQTGSPLPPGAFRCSGDWPLERLFGNEALEAFEGVPEWSCCCMFQIFGGMQENNPYHPCKSIFNVCLPISSKPTHTHEVNILFMDCVSPNCAPSVHCVFFVEAKQRSRKAPCPWWSCCGPNDCRASEVLYIFQPGNCVIGCWLLRT